MGCVFGKFSSPPRKDERSKRHRHKGNVKRVASRKGSRKEGLKREIRIQRPRVSVHNNNNKDSAAENNAQNISGGGAVRGEEKEKPVAREENKITRSYDLGDGWPKWLVDNIPKDVLDTLVPKSADSYVKLAKIGRGTYSNVYKAREKGTGKIVALKKVRFDTTDSESIKFMAREIMVLQKLDHPNVIKLEGLATSRMQYSLYLVFDFMESDLTRIISRPGERLTEPQIKCFMQQLLSGLQHCHDRGVMHRDIKASNLLIDKKGVLKIADFGLAKSFAVKHEAPLTNRVVTLWYRAPELLLGSTDYDFGIDLWSAGCLLAEMFVGRPIMPGRTEVEQLHMIFKLCGSPSENYWRKLKLTTSYRPAQHYKPSYREAFKNFPSSSYDLLATLLDLDPAHRGTAASALRSEFFKSSPLPCHPSALPVIYKDEDERLQIKRRKRQRALKRRQQSQPSTNDVIHSGRNQYQTDSKSSKELWEEKNIIEQHKEVGNSASSTSSGSRLVLNEGSSSMNASISPPFGEGHHPNALKNYSALLQASKVEVEGNDFAQLRRSFSTFDYRLDPDKIAKLSGLTKEI
ncbi:Serine/threonine-protein kinase, active site [Sesbania bispinosa]|nr:Serine/threonine-protein kinase, active site [Sesbania bispinosa]